MAIARAGARHGLARTCRRRRRRRGHGRSHCGGGAGTGRGAPRCCAPTRCFTTVSSVTRSSAGWSRLAAWNGGGVSGPEIRVLRLAPARIRHLARAWHARRRLPILCAGGVGAGLRIASRGRRAARDLARGCGMARWLSAWGGEGEVGTAKSQAPSSNPNHSQLPTPNSNAQPSTLGTLAFGSWELRLGFGSWEWLELGSWSLGLLKRSPKPLLKLVQVAAAKVRREPLFRNTTYSPLNDGCSSRTRSMFTCGSDGSGRTPRDRAALRSRHGLAGSGSRRRHAVSRSAGRSIQYDFFSPDENTPGRPTDHEAIDAVRASASGPHSASSPPFELAGGALWTRCWAG